MDLWGVGDFSQRIQFDIYGEWYFSIFSYNFEVFPVLKLNVSSVKYTGFLFLWESYKYVMRVKCSLFRERRL